MEKEKARVAALESQLIKYAKLIGDELDSEVDTQVKGEWHGMLELFRSWEQSKKIEYISSIDISSTTNFLAYLMEERVFNREIDGDIISEFINRAFDAKDSIEEERVWTLIFGRHNVADIMKLFEKKDKIKSQMWHTGDGRVQIRIKSIKTSRCIHKLQFDTYTSLSTPMVEDGDHKAVWESYVKDYQSKLTGAHHCDGKGNLINKA